MCFSASVSKHRCFSIWQNYQIEFNCQEKFGFFYACGFFSLVLTVVVCGGANCVLFSCKPIPNLERDREVKQQGFVIQKITLFYQNAAEEGFKWKTCC